MRFLFWIILCFPYLLYANDSAYYCSEAAKAEKVSPLLSIGLYEKCLETNLEKKYEKIAVPKLFDLYYKNSKIEEIIILGKEYTLDPNREKKLQALYRKLAKSIGMEEEKFYEFVDLLLQRDPKSRDKLLGFYVQEKSVYLLNYVFAMKYKINDLESLGYIISETPDMNPTLKLAFLVKIDSKNVESTVHDISKISDLTDDQRMEILYLYGIYLQRKRRYKMSARYFRMSASYEKEHKGFHKMGILEASKSLFITGKRKEACELLLEKRIYVQNESDEFMNLYCNMETREKLESIKPAIQVLSEKESGTIFRSFLSFDGPKKAKDKSQKEANQNESP